MLILAVRGVGPSEGVVKFERRGIDRAPLPALLFPPGSCMALSPEDGDARASGSPAW